MVTPYDITDVGDEATEPDFSPDGERLVVQSYIDGHFHLRLMDVDGTSVKLLTAGSSDHREPRFSPDGSQIAYSGEVGNRYAIRVLSLTSGETKTWTQGQSQEAQPTWSPDGSAIAFTVGTGAIARSIDVVDENGTRRTLVTVPDGRLAGPSFSPSGDRLAYVRLTSDRAELVVDGNVVSDSSEEVYPFPARWLSEDEILYTADGGIRRRVIGSRSTTVPFLAQASVPRVTERQSSRDFDSTDVRQVRGIVGPKLSPDGTEVAFAALGDIWLMQPGETPRAVVSDGHHNTAVTWSPDGRALAYISDRSGTAEIWLHYLASEQRRQLTNLGPGLRAQTFGMGVMAPTFSPDGRLIAFILGEEAVYTVDVTTGDVRLIVGSIFAPGPPSFAADSRHLSFAGLVRITPRFREGRNQILTVDIETGQLTRSEPIPGASLGNRVDSGPVYSPDGTTIAFVIDGTLWICAVDSEARPSGTPRKVNDQTADAPSWSADSKSLLYLCNGKLRLANVHDGAARSIPLPLQWRQTRPYGRTLIRAGALWDGVSSTLRREIDILIEANRITEIAPRGRASLDRHTRVINAENLTVMPGMIAVHEHGPWLRNTLGRLWLSFGVTTVRSTGTEHYRGVEAKEATDSGRRLGPRVFIAGDGIDGSRVFYSVVRSVRGAKELRRELDKAKALSHDLVKTYVRLPYPLQQMAITSAHDQGLPLTSHYMFGPLTFGVDGTEHIGGTSRYGRRQKETHLGHSHQDVIEPMVRSGMSFTPTLGLGGADLPTWESGLYRHAAWALGDARLVNLLTPAEYDIVRAGIEDALEHEPVPDLAFIERQVSTIRRMIDGGGHVVLGTDSPLVPLGMYYHLNMQAMQRYGIEPYEVLRSATSEGARALGVSAQLGTVEPGKLADLVLVNGNPLGDVAAAASVHTVIANGVVHHVNDLISATGSGAQALSNVELAAVPQAAARRDHWWLRPGEHGAHPCC